MHGVIMEKKGTMKKTHLKKRFISFARCAGFSEGSQDLSEIGFCGSGAKVDLGLNFD